MSATAVMGQQGRLVIPSDIRDALDLQPGDELHLHLSGRRLVIETQRDARRALRGYTASAAAGRSLVDELLAERRAEVAADGRS